MTPSEWLDHANQCRKLAETMEDEAARRVLLEAAEDYIKAAANEITARSLTIPAYQIEASGRHRSNRSGMR
jgi:hypothetical protein